MKPQTAPTIKLANHPHSTMQGYIFNDEHHARKWLQQAPIKEYHDQIRLERGVPFKGKCSECGQETTKFHLIERLTVRQFLGENDDN